MTIIGIDPGKTGGIAFIAPTEVIGFPLPCYGKDLDVKELKMFIESEDETEFKAYIETPFIRARQAGALTTGMNYGRILAVLSLMDIPTVCVTPASWSTKMLGTKGKDKGANIAMVRKLFPSTTIIMPGSRTPHTGVVDALLIAEYGRRQK